MVTTECKHGLDPAWCTTCKLGPTLTRPWRPVVSDRTGDRVVIAARYEGECRACGGTIAVGERIMLQERDDEQRWVCGACADD